jgi:hypothetical protein
MSEVLKDALRLDVSPEVNCYGRHILRWTERVSWGDMTLLITVAAPEALAQAREDFSLFCTLPPDQRQAAANAVRLSAEPAATILKLFLPAAAGDSQQSLF